MAAQNQSVEVSEAVGTPDERPIYDALRAADVPESLAYPATQRVRDLAGVNTVTRLRAAIQAQGAELNARMDALTAEVNAKIDALRTEVNARIDALRTEVNARIDGLAAELGGRIDALAAKLEAVTSSLRWMMGVVLALFAAIVILLALVLQELARLPGRSAAPPPTVEAPRASSGSEAVGTSVPDEAPPTAP